MPCATVKRCELFILASPFSNDEIANFADAAEALGVYAVHHPSDPGLEESLFKITELENLRALA